MLASSEILWDKSTSMMFVIRGFPFSSINGSDIRGMTVSSSYCVYKKLWSVDLILMYLHMK